MFLETKNLLSIVTDLHEKSYRLTKENIIEVEIFLQQQFILLQIIWLFPALTNEIGTYYASPAQLTKSTGYGEKKCHVVVNRLFFAHQ